MDEMAVDVAGGIQCGCGQPLSGQDEEELLLEADLHVRSVHPELVGTLSPLELAKPAFAEEAAV